MKLASVWLFTCVLMLAACGGNVRSTTPPASSVGVTPAPAPNGTPVPSTPAPTPTAPFATPGGLPTVPTSPIPPGDISPIIPTVAPTTPVTPTGGTVTVGPTAQPVITGIWVATLTTTTGTPALAFSAALQQNADGSVTGTSITFSLGSPCFGANTTATGRLTGTSLSLRLTSLLTSGAVNALQISAAVNAAATAMTGTFVVAPAAGVTACGNEAGTIIMVRQ